MSCLLPEQWSFMHRWLTQVSIEQYFCFEVWQDIRDLFNLTTSHMSTYMVVGTLFLGFSVSFMWSGIQNFPENPPWLKLLWVNCFISAMCYGFLVPGLNGWCGWVMLGIGLFGCCLYKQDLQLNSTVARFADCNRTYISIYIRWRNHQYYTTKQISIFQMKDASILNSWWHFGGLLNPRFHPMAGFYFDEHHLWSTKKPRFEVKVSPCRNPVGPNTLPKQAVWLAMHGAIAAQSASVQLLTRAIRPPYPSASELKSVKHELAHYESSGGDEGQTPR